MRNILLLLILLASFSVKAQITTPVVRANFGVDGDLRANYLTGIGVTGSADDWFADGTPGTGRNVIDTTGAAAIIKGYNTDASPWPNRMATFFRGMSLPTFTVFNNRLWLDALYVRDYHGNDTTVYTSGADKNGQSPAFWSGGIQGIPDKNDILDVMMHVRRAGPNTTDSLWMFGGISIVNTTGNRYFDFEMYQTDISYDRASAAWYGYGPDAGHTSWKFDATGKGQFQSSTLTSIEARIWVSKADWQTVTPTAFSWSGQFDGDGMGATYGYASISPKVAGTFYTGLGSPASTWSGPFGLVLQDNSLSYTNPGPASTTNGKYVATQFIEFSVNLTKLGLDPVTTFGGDVCGTPFNRLVVKTRASASFTAELKDFVAPIDLFLAPRAVALADVPLFCGAMGVSHIEVQNPSTSSTYTWTTPDGHIVGPSTGPNIVVDSPGTYMVTQRLSSGCNPYAYDTVAIVYQSDCGTLDNTILDFKGAINNDITKLDWTIADNQYVSYFEVERSFDGRTFDGVNQTTANDQIKSSASYSAYDNLQHLSPPGAIYYRLKIVKTSGGVSYSQVIRIPYGKSLTKFSIIPNPVHDVMQVAVNAGNDGSLDLRIFDMAGKVVRNLRANVQSGVNVISFDQLSRLQEGTYIVVVYTGTEILRQKIVLVK
jgi:type IX secretion system substrate protein